MAIDQWSDNAETVLSAGIDADDTTIPVLDSTGFETPGTGYYATIAQDEGNPLITKREVVRVTGRPNGTSFTVTRNAWGQGAQSFSIGAKFEQRLTSLSLDKYELAAEANVNIIAHGASVDEEDNIAAINAAIQAASDAGGGSVFIPPGTFEIAPSGTGTYIVAKSNVTLRGCGPASVLKVKNDAGNYRTVIGATATVTNFVLENVTIDQNHAGNTTCDVQVADGQQQFAFWLSGTTTTDIAVRNCRFDSCTGINTVVVNSVGGKRVAISGNYFRFKQGATSATPGYDNSAVYIEAQSSIVIGNHFHSDDYDDVPGASIEVHGSQSVVTGNMVEGYQVGCWAVSPFTLSDQLTNSTITISGNSFARVACGVGLICATSGSNASPVLRNVTVHGNTIGILQAGSNHDAEMSFGIDVKNAGGTLENLMLAGNTIHFEPDTRTSSTRWGSDVDSAGIWTGIRVGVTDGISDCTIEGNIIQNAPFMGICVGVFSASCVMKRVVVRHNRLIDPGRNSNAEPSYLRVGLEVTGAMTDCVIEDNEHIDTATGGTPNGLSSYRIYPAVSPVRTYFRRNPATVAGSGALTALYVDATALLGGPSEGQEAIAYAASITPDPLKPSMKVIGTLTGNTAIAAPELSLAGQRMTFVFTQDGSGGHTVSWNAAYKVNWTPDTTAGKKNSIAFEHDGSNWVQVGAATGL